MSQNLKKIVTLFSDIVVEHKKNCRSMSGTISVVSGQHLKGKNWVFFILEMFSFTSTVKQVIMENLATMPIFFLNILCIIMNTLPYPLPHLFTAESFKKYIYSFTSQSKV